MSSRAVVAVASSIAMALVAAAAFLISRDSDASAAAGDLIAYGCKEKNNPWWAICVVRVDGTDAKRLTQGVATSDPSWSPEGNRLAFTRHEVGGEFTQSSQDDMFVMDAPSWRPTATGETL